MSSIPPTTDDLFSRESIKDVLKSWEDPRILGQHDLAKLRIVELQRLEDGYENSQIGKGLALRAVLRQEIDNFKPNGEEPIDLTKKWQYYIILREQYIEGYNRIYVEKSRDIPHTTYGRRQNEALKQLANRLLERGAKKSA